MDTNAPAGTPGFLPIGSALLHIQSWLTGREEAFTRWCDECHHAEALQTPGYLACRRFELVPGYEYAAPQPLGALGEISLCTTGVLSTGISGSVSAAFFLQP